MRVVVLQVAAACAVQRDAACMYNVNAPLYCARACCCSVCLNFAKLNKNVLALVVHCAIISNVAITLQTQSNLKCILQLIFT